MDMVYEVVGERGRYSDWQTWTVCVYPDRELAEQHVKAINEVLPEALRANRSNSQWLGDDPFDFPLDPHLARHHLWDSYLDYSVEEVPFRLHVDQFLGVDAR